MAPPSSPDYLMAAMTGQAMNVLGNIQTIKHISYVPHDDVFLVLADCPAWGGTQTQFTVSMPELEECSSMSDIEALFREKLVFSGMVREKYQALDVPFTMHEIDRSDLNKTETVKDIIKDLL